MVGSCALANGRICAGDESAVGVWNAAEKTAVRDEKAAGRAERSADADVSSAAAEEAAGRDEQTAAEGGIADAGASSSATGKAAGQDEQAAGAEEAVGRGEQVDADDVGSAGRSGEVGETMTLQLNHVQHHYQTSVEYLAPMALH